jgi:signal peptidase I
MMLQLQQQEQWQWQAEPQFQTYESFSQILMDVPQGPVIASFIIAVLPFVIYIFWKKAILRTYFIAPLLSVFYWIYYYIKYRPVERRVKEEVEGIVGKKTGIIDIFEYGSYVGMVALGLLVLKKSFFLSLVISQSMAPTLMEADMVIVESLTTENIEVGDIIVFTPAERYADESGRLQDLVIHRVTSVEGGKIKTKGDNAGHDPWVLTQENIQGKVVTFNGKPAAIKGVTIGPLELRSPGEYFMPRPKVYLEGSDPVYETTKEYLRKVHIFGPIILIIILFIIMLSAFERKSKYKSIYK